MARHGTRRLIKKLLQLSVIVFITLAVTYTLRNRSFIKYSFSLPLEMGSIHTSSKDLDALIVYDLSKPVDGRNITCANLTTPPRVPICFHSKEDFLSELFMSGRIWEYHVISKMKTLLGSDCSYGLIDIGANLGYYGLVAAAMGHRVVAVEPLEVNVMRFHKALKLAGNEDKVVLIQNALSNERKNAEMVLQADNIGGSSVATKCSSNFGGKCTTVQTVYLDDILPYISFRKAVMKMDIEGYEHRAILKASNLFARIDIPYIFMEFMNLKSICDETGTQSRGLLNRMFAFFNERNYLPFNAEREQALEIQNCQYWPIDILWIRTGLPYPLPWPIAIN